MADKRVVFADTNILLDVMLNRKPFVEDAKLVLQLAVEGAIDLYVSDLTIINAVYVGLRQKQPLENIYMFLDNIHGIVNVSSTGAVAINKARILRNRDFEDAVQYYSAEACNSDCIVTRNVHDFPQGAIAIVSPSEFLASYYE